MYDGSINWMPPGMILSLKNTVIDPFIYRTRALRSSLDHRWSKLKFFCSKSLSSLLHSDQ